MEIMPTQAFEIVKAQEKQKKGGVEEGGADFQGLLAQIINLRDFCSIENKEPEGILEDFQPLSPLDSQQDTSAEVSPSLDENIEGEKNIIPLLEIPEKADYNDGILLGKEDIQLVQTIDDTIGPLEKLAAELQTKTIFQEEIQEVNNLAISWGKNLEDFPEDNLEIDLQQQNEEKKDILKPLLEENTIEVKDRYQDKGWMDNKTLPPQQVATSPKEIFVVEKVQSTEVHNIPEIGRELVKEIKVLKAGDQSALTLKLQPKELGEIKVKLEIREGEVVGEILVKNSAVKNILQGQLEHLKEQLTSQNIQTKEISVEIQQEGGGRERNNNTFFSNQDSSSRNPSKEFIKKDEKIDRLNFYQPVVENNPYKRGIMSSLNLLA